MNIGVREEVGYRDTFALLEIMLIIRPVCRRVPAERAAKYSPLRNKEHTDISDGKAWLKFFLLLHKKNITIANCV